MCPDNRQHRGAHPADERLFEPARLPALRRATAELSWLLSRDYTLKASLKLVGDRHRLSERQRLAVSRAACADTALERRALHLLPIEETGGRRLLVDGFNLIITMEAALGRGPLLVCRDDCIRDISSVHGSYRSVLETERAILLVGEALERLGPKSVHWFLDRPISNSGRLAKRIEELAQAHEWPWQVDVVFNPDAALISSGEIIVSSDSAVIDRAAGWLNLTAHLIKRYLSEPWLIDLRTPGSKVKEKLTSGGSD